MNKLIDLKNIDGLDDKELSEILKKNFQKKIKIVLQHRTVLVFIDDIFNAKGEFSELCLKIVKNQVNISYYKIKHPTNKINQCFFEIPHLDNFDIQNIKEWSKNSSKRLKADKSTEQKLWSNAKERCQLCGRDLSSHHFTKKKGNFAQIAHIEASGIDGPRSNKELENTNELNNLMLLCYDCHRLVDFITPEKYTVQALRDIKINQEAKAKLLLNTLSYNEVTPIRISTKLHGDDFVYASDTQIIEALSQKQLSISNNPLSKNLLSHPLNEKRNPHNSKYWLNFFDVYQKEVIYINDKKDNSSEIAMFIYHGISDMIFLGSRFGDTVNVHLFQKHRQENENFGWTWPNENDKIHGNNLSFSSNIIKDVTSEKEGLLLVTLTADINTNELPLHLYNNEYILPTIQIESSEKRVTVISKEKDLKTVQNLLYKAIQKMKDEWKLTKIHIVVIAPTVINFSIGRAIQTKYHGEIICYEKNSNTKKQEQTICITDEKVYYIGDSNIYMRLI